MDNQEPQQPAQPQPSQQTPSTPGASSSTNFWKHTRLLLLILGFFCITIYGKCRSNKQKGGDNVPGQAIEIEHPNNVKIAEPKKPGLIGRLSPTITDTHYIPPEGNVTITPKDPTKSIDDLIRVKYQESGLVFEPGIEVSGSLYYNIGIDAKLLYSHRFGLGVGLVTGSNVTFLISPDIFASYRLDQLHLPNSEAILTYTPISKIPIGVGVRINL